MARSKMTPRQSRFVKNLLEGMAKAKAAEAAGYKPSNAANTAAILLSDDRVLEALRDGAERRMKAGAYIGARVLLDLAENAKSEDIKLRAATALLDRGGMPLVKQSEITHRLEDRRSDAELRAHAIALARQLGVPIPSNIIDAEFAPVPQPALPAPAAEVVSESPNYVDVFGDD
jgi:hypothetical protein